MLDITSNLTCNPYQWPTTTRKPGVYFSRLSMTPWLTLTWLGFFWVWVFGCQAGDSKTEAIALSLKAEVHLQVWLVAGCVFSGGFSKWRWVLFPACKWDPQKIHMSNVQKGPWLSSVCRGLKYYTQLLWGLFHKPSQGSAPNNRCNGK